MAAPTPDDGSAKVRVDKWLWAARFFKTRSLASAAVDAGQVRVNGDRVKPARAVRAGDRITIRKAGFEWNAQVLAIAERRGSATEAAKLYVEPEASRKAREEEYARRQAAAAASAHASGRPTKRDRRRLEDFLNEP
jgi:ribosome-associated heat shock protein Hsp15